MVAVRYLLLHWASGMFCRCNQVFAQATEGRFYHLVPARKGRKLRMLLCLFLFPHKVGKLDDSETLRADVALGEAQPSYSINIKHYDMPPFKLTEHPSVISFHSVSLMLVHVVIEFRQILLESLVSF